MTFSYSSNYQFHFKKVISVWWCVNLKQHLPLPDLLLLSLERTLGVFVATNIVQ